MSSNNNNNASNPPITEPQLLDRFKALTFTEVRKVTCVSKIVNVCNVMIAFLSICSRIPIVGFVAAILKIVPMILVPVFRLLSEPLRILIEAEDNHGGITLLMIKDGRRLLSRLLGIDKLDKMNLFYLNDKKTNLMTTNKKWVFDFCCGCCCGVPVSCCYRLKQLELKNSIDGTIQAHHSFKRCTQSSSKVTYVNFGDTDEQKIAFFEPKGRSCVFCGENKEDHNTIVIDSARPSSELKANITFTPIGIRDFLMESGEIALEEVTETTLDQVLDEDEEEALGELKDAADEIKENIDELKEQGYQKIMNSESTWKVTFPTEYTHQQKCAVMLYAIEQYSARL